jgi:hypothetical protein
VKHITDQGFTKQTLLALIASGELKAINIVRRGNSQRKQWRIAVADWQAFLDARSNKPPAPKLTRGRRRKEVAVTEYVR